MKLRNKKSGEIIDLYEGLIRDDGEHIIIKPVSVLEKCYVYNSIAELNAEWEDYKDDEEPKKYWFINWNGDIDDETDDGFAVDKSCKEIGNYFKTKKEAEKAVEKLKAWKQLKDDGITFTLDESNGTPFIVIGSKEETGTVQKVARIVESLTLLFGGEDE